MVTDEWLAHQLAQDRRLQTKLQVTRKLFERVPDVVLVFEQLGMGRVFEVKKIGGREHSQRSRWRIALRVASAFFGGAQLAACAPQITPLHGACASACPSCRALPR